MKNNKILAWVYMIIGIIYLLNLGFGFIEFIPDNAPVIGNLDEGAAGALILQGFRMLGRKK